MKRKPKKKQSPLLRRLEQHDRMCTVHVYSGDRHCSCGRDQALLTVARLREILKDNPEGLALLG